MFIPRTFKPISFRNQNVKCVQICPNLAVFSRGLVVVVVVLVVVFGSLFVYNDDFMVLLIGQIADA